MQFVILRLLRHNELGMFHSYRRLGKEGSKQRAINFDGDVVDRVFPAAKDEDIIRLAMRYETDNGIGEKNQKITRQAKNWRLEGNCPKDRLYDFVDPGCLFAMQVDAGTSPATGAWAVYPEEDEVTKLILAHAESKKLVRSSMIALHDGEGERTLQLLRGSKPQLFGTDAFPEAAGPAAGQSIQPPAGNGVHLPPKPKRLVQILASVGHTLPSAVADIVDNAISKGATEIRIQFRPPDKGHGRWMAITDNGSGMNRRDLEEAMTIGSEVDYDAGDLGKYGYGLKGASWSQTNKFTVVSKRKGGETCHLSWDANTMESWVAQDSPLEPWVSERVELGDHGTCVFWENMRPPKSTPRARGTDPYTAEVQALARHLGLVFHRFLEGKAHGRQRLSLVFNDGYIVEPNNPVGHRKTSPYDRKSIRVPTADDDAIVFAQAFLLPSESEIKEMHGGDSEAAREDLARIGMYGRRNESQGIYVYRNDRLIQWGGWHDIWKTVDEKKKLARVTVDFGSELDAQFDVNISKMKVTLSLQLQEAIKKIAEPARKDSERKFREEKPPKPKRKAAPPAPPPGRPAPPDPGPGGASSGPDDPHAAPAKPVPPVRRVKTASFAWKVTKSMTGAEEIQISEMETDLQALAASVGNDPGAVASLAAFLKRLDRAGVQEALRKDRKS